MRLRLIINIITTMIGLCALMPATHAAEIYPTRAVKIIVPFAPGGVTDLLARVVAQKLSQKFGQPVTVENKGGAGTIVAAVATSEAPADGYTLMLATGSTMSINSTLYKRLPYNPDTELTPVAFVASSPFLLITNPDLPVKNVEDLIKLAKAEPGKLNYGTGGVGSTVSVLPALMKSMTGTRMTEVPYRGTMPALTDTMAGQIQFMFVDIAAGEGVVKENKVRVLGISTAKRFEGLPDVPTIAESGVPGFDGDSWQMIVAPAKTPKDIVTKLNAAIGEIVAQPDFREQMIKLGAVPGRKDSPEGLRSFVNAETTRWGKVLTDAGMAHSQ
ncbi:MAG: tripartite tricarboxylate transporter substrate binding protein [Xanthobacteraceae bacterium]